MQEELVMLIRELARLLHIYSKDPDREGLKSAIQELTIRLEKIAKPLSNSLAKDAAGLKDLAKAFLENPSKEFSQDVSEKILRLTSETREM